MITPWPWPVTSQGLSWLQGQASSPLGEDDLPGDRLAAVEQGSGTSCHLARGRLHCPLPTHGPQAGAAALPGCTLPLLLFFLLPKGKACSGRGPLSPPTAIYLRYSQGEAPGWLLPISEKCGRRREPTSSRCIQPSIIQPRWRGCPPGPVVLSVSQALNHCR